MKRVLVCSPHPDDETLGAGGLILKLKHEKKADIGWLNFTCLKQDLGFSQKQMSEKKEQIQKVAKEYHFDYFKQLDLETTKLDTFDKSFLVGLVSETMKEFKPDTILLPYRYDIHSDHKAVFDAVISNTKVFRYEHISKILIMEIISETNFATKPFKPNYFTDISRYMDKKIDIFKIYKNEIQQNPFPRSIEKITSLASYRGAACNCDYAEAFSIFKWIG